MYAYTNITSAVVIELLADGWTFSDLDQLNTDAATRGITVSFLCKTAEENTSTSLPGAG